MGGGEWGGCWGEGWLFRRLENEPNYDSITAFCSFELKKRWLIKGGAL